MLNIIKTDDDYSSLYGIKTTPKEIFTDGENNYIIMNGGVFTVDLDGKYAIIKEYLGMEASYYGRTRTS